LNVTPTQPTESYEAVNNSTSSYLFISCPNWGQDDSNYGTYNTCPHYSGTNDNGTLQSYQESHGGAGYSSLLVFNDIFTYDNLNRLNTATDTNQASSLQWARTYNYDQWGNMWQPNPYNQPVSGNTPTTNVYSASTNHDTRWTYDNAGNLTNVNGNGAAYNAENQITWLSATTGNGGGAETLAYDAVGQRIQKTISGTGGSTTVYVYDAFGQLASEYVNGTSTRDYVFDGAGDLMAIENASGPCTTCYLAYDHLGSVRLVMDQNANVVGRHDYLPFGQEVSGYAGRTTPGFNVPGSVPNDATQKFTGQIRDQESGMDFFNARYLTWSLGRFNSPDPGNAGANLISSQSWNGYAYVLGNPLNAVDPTGTHWVITPVCSPGPNRDGITCTNNWAWVDDGPTIFLNAGNNGPSISGSGSAGSTSAPKPPPTVWHCLGVAAADKGPSIGLDVIGAIPAVGNVASAAGLIRAAINVNKVITNPAVGISSGVYGAYGAAKAGSENPTDSLVGAGSAGAGIGLALADLSLGGTKAIPIVGNAVSLLTLGWDGYQASKTYQSCMAGH
jgi:RHS repeat-associated protein